VEDSITIKKQPAKE